MVQKSLLLVDADPRSLRVLDVSLRTAGYELASCGDVEAALARIAASPPDLLLLDTRLPGASGFELVEAVRKNPASERMPIIILSSDTSVESKVRGLKLGVDDYLTKPIYLKEILARIQLALSRVERDSLARRGPSGKTRLTGSLADMGIVDLLQTIDLGRKSGALELRAGDRRGEVSFREGQVLDARLGPLRGERALYRMLLWSDGEFAIDFRAVTDAQRVAVPTQGLLMEGMRRLDEWSRLTARLPPLDVPLDVDVSALRDRLTEVPDEANPLLCRIDGRRSALAVLDATEADDLVTLDLLATLCEGGILRPVGAVQDRASPDGGALHAPGPRTSGQTTTAAAAPPAGAALPAAKSGQEPSSTSAQTVSPTGGTAPASEPTSAPSGREAVTKVGPASFPPPASTPKSTLIGLGFDPATLLTAVGASSAGGPRPPGPASDDEDPMSKKKRKNRSGSEQRDSQTGAPASAELARKQEPARHDEAPTRADASGEGNVIQFPAKRSLPPAANDDDGDADEGAESMPPRASSAPERRSSPELGAAAQGRAPQADDDGLPAAIPEGTRRDEKRRKKGGPGAGPALADDPSSEDFFRGSAPPPVDDDFSDLSTGLPSMGKESKQWMYRTFGIFAIFAVAIGGYWYYHNVHLPQPVEIGTARRSMPSLPPPSATATAAAAPAEAPEASPPEAVVEAAPVEGAVEAPPEVAAAEPTEVAPVEAAPVEAAPVEAAPVEAAPVEAAPAAAAAGESYASVLAEAEAARRRPSTAIPLYERAIELDPNGIEALSQLSYLLINRGRGDDIRRAAGFAERATGLAPSDSLAWLVLGVARETLGDRAGARAAYRACVEQGEPGRWQNECRPHAR